MRRLLKGLILLISISIPLLLTSLTGIMASTRDFEVRPMRPDNQRENGRTYFDLLVTPGLEQQLIIEIRNVSENDMTVLVEMITASTDNNGEIDYFSRGMIDETLAFSFEDLVSLEQNRYEIPAQSGVEVAIDLKIPDEVFEGVILGSINVVMEVEQAGRRDENTTNRPPTNVTAVTLVHDVNAEDIPADFALGDITTKYVNNRPTTVAHIRNTQPKVILGASATARIYSQDGSEFVFEFEHSITNLGFAPNSVFQFAFSDDEGNDIEPGNYTAVIAIAYGGETWNFQQEFRVAAPGLALWMIIAIGAGGVILIGTIVLIIVRVRRGPRFPSDF